MRLGRCSVVCIIKYRYCSSRPLGLCAVCPCQHLESCPPALGAHKQLPAFLGPLLRCKRYPNALHAAPRHQSARVVNVRDGQKVNTLVAELGSRSAGPPDLSLAQAIKLVGFSASAAAVIVPLINALGRASTRRAPPLVHFHAWGVAGRKPVGLEG